MIKKVFSLSSLSLVQYLINFIKQIVISKHIGVSPELDIYLYILSIVNMLHFFSGPISEATLPKLFKENSVSKEQAGQYFSKLLNNIFAICAVSSLVMYFLFNNSFYSPLNSETMNIALAQEFAYLMIPLILINTLHHVFSGILNIFDRFIFQTIAKTFTSLFSLVLMIVLIPKMGVKAILYSFLAFNILTVLLQTLDIIRAKIRYTFKSGFILDNKAYKLLVGLSFSHFLAALYLIYERSAYLSLGEGNLSAFNYAISLRNIPIQLLLFNITAITWTKILEKNDQGGIESSIHISNKILNLFLPICIFIVLYTFILNDQIVYVLFKRGKLDITAQKMISYLLVFAIMAFPIQFFISIKERIFTTLRKTKILTAIGAIFALGSCLFIYLANYYQEPHLLYLAPFFGHSLSSIFVIWKLRAHKLFPIFPKINLKVLSINLSILIYFIIIFKIKNNFDLTEKSNAIAFMGAVIIIPLLSLIPFKSSLKNYFQTIE